ncbi:TOM7 family-domain-containing protein [Gilbertella persicaria]|nr:TOM7 family-domain-containing protein [Gilbertella persicaria]KAI8057579.1 TOM7 family-domain-containing protein [Gilbertella persicaria]KAI8359112.1 TOM7 family-domain-containing protein [Choanephora cucurbitarum]KAI8390333.1 TOM7 family-domain-containing protein [Blakeslea trispora]
MNDSTKDTLYKVADVTKTIIHWGFIPFVIYLGMTRSNPRPSILKLVSPLA